MQPTSQPKKTVPSFGKHIFAIGVALIVVLAIVFMFSSRQGKSDLAAQLFPISIGPSSSNSVSLVCKPNSPSSVKVVSPNGGEIFVPGQQVQVTWTSCKLASGTTLRVYLGYYVGGTLSGAALLGGTAGASNSVQVTLPSTTSFGQGAFQYGQNFKIIVTNGTNAFNGTVSDASDLLFSINSSPVSAGTAVQTSFVNAATQIMAGSGSNDDTGIFKIRFTVTAANGDVYIPRNATGVPQAVEYMFEKNGVPAAVTQGWAASLTDMTSASTTAGNNYFIPNGQTHTFELSGMLSLYGSGQAGAYRFRMTDIHWSDTDSIPNHTLTLQSPYVTPYINLN